MVQPLQNMVWPFLKDLNIGLPYDLAIPPLGTHTKELKARNQTDVWVPMFTAALLQ